jgi:hypothetical protein
VIRRTILCLLWVADQKYSKTWNLWAYCARRMAQCIC